MPKFKGSKADLKRGRAGDVYSSLVVLTYHVPGPGFHFRHKNKNKNKTNPEKPRWLNDGDHPTLGSWLFPGNTQ